MSPKQSEWIQMIHIAYPTSLGLRGSWLIDRHVQTWEWSCLSHLVVKIQSYQKYSPCRSSFPLFRIPHPQKEILQREYVEVAKGVT